MINNKKGLSMIVSTLIIILLVLVAIGIIWTVVRNVIDSGVDTVDVSSKCLNLDIAIKGLDCATDPDCDVYFERGPGGEEPNGLMMAFTGVTAGQNFVVDYTIVADTLEELELLTVSANDVETILGEDVTAVEVTPYYDDSSGVAQLCGTSVSYTA